MTKVEGGQALLTVQGLMDDADAIIDTLIWDASGKDSDSGWDAMDKAGMDTDAAKEQFQESLLQELEDAELIFGENIELASKQIDGTTLTFENICDELSALEDQVKQSLANRYDSALAIVKTRIELTKPE